MQCWTFTCVLLVCRGFCRNPTEHPGSADKASSAAGQATCGLPASCRWHGPWHCQTSPWWCCPQHCRMHGTHWQVMHSCAKKLVSAFFVCMHLPRSIVVAWRQSHAKQRSSFDCMSPMYARCTGICCMQLVIRQRCVGTPQLPACLLVMLREHIRPKAGPYCLPDMQLEIVSLLMPRPGSEAECSTAGLKFVVDIP